MKSSIAVGRVRLSAFTEPDSLAAWLKEHAWKLIPLARADAHQNPPTHSRSTTSRNIDMRRRVPVDDGV